MSTTLFPDAKKFDLRLQSIRGLAAFVVAFHHSFNVLPFSPFFDRILRGVEGIVSPQAAVLTFFVLSGYVLGLSLNRTAVVDWGSYLQFMIRRVCRIMIPLSLVILGTATFVCGLIWCITGQTFLVLDRGEHSLLASTYWRPLSSNVLVSNIFLIDHDLDSVTWTIAIEMAGSAFLPLFFWINKIRPFRLPLLALLMGISLVSRAEQTSFWHYLYIFDLGLLIPFWGANVFSFLEKWRLRTLALFMAVMGCFINGHLGHNFYLLSLELSFLLGFVIFRHDRALRVLDHRASIWLGKVSYSFYLAHWPILWSVTWLSLLVVPRLCSLHPVLTSFGLFFLSVSITAALAEILYRTVERPAIQLGRLLSDIPAKSAR